MSNQKSDYRYDEYEDKEVFTDHGQDTVAKINEDSLQLRTNNTLDLQIEEMIEKNKGVWKCKICGKISGRKDVIRKHAEIHIDGMSHPCNICSKTFKNRNGLNTHNYRDHKRRHHNEDMACEAKTETTQLKYYL